MTCEGDVTRDDLQRRFLAQHRVAALLQHCFERLQHCFNIALKQNKAILMWRVKVMLQETIYNDDF